MYYGMNLSLGGVGSYVGSIPASQIVYTNVLNNFVYDTYDTDQYGEELVVNGTFDTDLTGWSVNNGSAIAWVSGEMSVERLVGGATWPNSREALTGLIIGNTYMIVSEFSTTSGTIESYHSVAGLSEAEAKAATDSSGTLTSFFTATSTSHNIDVGIWGDTGAINDTVEFDNISVKEITATAGQAYVDNLGQTRSKNDLLMASGRAVELGATNDVDVPIHHTLGSEEVTNGTFDSDVIGWTNNGTSTITWSSGSAIVSRNLGAFANQCYQDITTVIGTTYFATVEIVSVTGSSTASIVINGTEYSNQPLGINTYYFTAVSTTTRISLNVATFTDGAITVDNVSVKEITSMANSFLTYQDITTNEIITLGNSVDGGSSKELSVNGTFDTDTDWTKGTGWTISGGKATYDGLSGTQPIVSAVNQGLTIGKLYKVELEVITQGTGNNTIYLDGITEINSINLTTGYHTFFGTAAQDGLLYVYGRTGSTFEIDNISVKEILPISTTYTLNDITTNNILTHATNFSTADRTAIEANPNLIGALALSGTGTIDELDMVLSSELVSNGNFNSGTTGWSGITVAGGVAKTSGGEGIQTITHTAGASVNLSFIADNSGVTPSFKVYDGIGIGGTELVSISITGTGFNDYTASFDLISDTFTIALLNGSDTALWDNFSIKEVVQDQYFPAMEKSGAYLVDARSVGSELVTNGTFNTDITNWTDNLSTSSWSSGAISILYGLNPTGAYQSFTTIAGRTYFATVEVISSTTYSSNTLLRVGNGSMPDAGLADSDAITTTGTTSVVFTATGTTSYIYLRNDLNSTTVWDNVSVKEATVIEIANYTGNPQIRTNANQLEVGIQHTAFTKDALGVPTAYDTQALNWQGDSYGDMQFMPPSDSAWEMDLVMECVADGTLSLSGIYSATSANNFFIGQHSLSGLYGNLGGTTIGSSATAVSDGWHHIRIEFDGSGNGNFVVDNTTTYAYTSSAYSYTANESFYLGDVSRAKAPEDFYPLEQPTGYVQYVNKVRTADERTADYNKAKAMHPTLP